MIEARSPLSRTSDDFEIESGFGEDMDHSFVDLLKGDHGEMSSVSITSSAESEDIMVPALASRDSLYLSLRQQARELDFTQRRSAEDRQGDLRKLENAANYIKYLQDQLQQQYLELQNTRAHLSKVSTAHDALLLQQRWGAAILERLENAQWTDLTCPAAMEFSVPQVMRIMHALNREISKNAALISEQLATRAIAVESHQNKAQVYNHKVSERVSRILGKELTQVLEAKRRANLFDEDLVHVALQVGLARCCSDILASWLPREQKEIDKVLQIIYGRIRKTESPAGSGKWRSLTLNHIRKESKDISKYVSPMTEDLSYIVLFTGTACSSHSEASTFLFKFKKHFEKLVQFSLCLSTAIGEGVVTVEIWPYIVCSGHKFNDLVMIDVEDKEDETKGNTHLRERGKVAGTTDLGLFAGTKGKEVVLIKAKVVLCSALT